MTKDLAVIEHVNGTALQPYHDRDEVRELANRLLSLHPAASEVGQAGMTAVAQLALMIGASPLPGVNEIHVWTSKDRDGTKKVQFQLGVNYFRRRSDEAGGVLWKVKPRQMDDRERKEYGIVQGQLAAICEAVRVVDMEKFTSMGFTPNQVWDMKSSVGTAVAGINESKHGRSPIWTALKRCEVDLYRQLFPTMMRGIQEAQGQYAIEAEPYDGPDWGDEDEFEQRVEASQDDIFAPDGSAPVEAEYEEIPETDQELAEEAEPQEQPERVDIGDLAMMVADIRADLESRIKDDRVLLGDVYETAVDTGLYTNWRHAYNAVSNSETGYEALKGKKTHKNVQLTGKGGLMVFDWLVERKIAGSDEEE